MLPAMSLARRTPDEDLAPVALETWLDGHRRAVLLGLVAMAILVRVLLGAQLAHSPLTRIHDIVPESDNRFFDLWGRHLADGDWMQPAPWHPMTQWMKWVAAEVQAIDPHLAARALGPAVPADPGEVARRLWDHWLKGASFFQEPAYPYLVGLTYALTGANAWHVYAWQLALGVAGMALVHQLALRLLSHSAAFFAALLYLLSPLPLVLEVTLLRDLLVVFTTIALALLLHWAPEGGRGRWAVLGCAFGVALLVKSSFLAFPLLMALWRAATVRATWRERAPALALTVAGMVVGLLPAILRNLAVGVRPLTLNGSGESMLALFHTAHSAAIGVNVPAEFPSILAAHDGHLLPSLLAAARTHAEPWGIAVLTARKLIYAWHAMEAPNNVDLDLFRQASSLVRALPVGIVVVAPLAALGAASRRAASRSWPLLLAVLASLATLALGSVLSRYRAPLVAVLLPLAGAGVVRAWTWARTRRFRSLTVAAALAVPYVAWALAPAPGFSPQERAAEYVHNGEGALSAGETAFAILHFQAAVHLEPADPGPAQGLGLALLRAGRAHEAVPYLARAAQSTASPRVREMHAFALAEDGRWAEARAEAQAALAGDPSLPTARAIVAGRTR